MWTRIREFLAPPVFAGDEDKTRVARLLNAILLFILAVLVAVTIPVLILPESSVEGLQFVGLTAVLTVGAWILLRSGYLRLASGLFVAILGLLELGTLILTGGLRSPTAAGFIVFVVVAALLLGRFGAIVSGGLTILAGLGVYVAGANGILPPPLVNLTPQLGLINVIGNVTLAALLLHLAIGSLDEALERARQQAGELEQQREHLEETVEARTRDLTRRTRYLEATAAVAQDTASLLDLERQLVRIVNLVSEQFGFYHTGIFLLDPAREWAVLEAASSEGGQRMLARDHRLRVGVGIVGYVVEQGEPRVALDVGEDAVFFDNPDLPNTRSEMALPLRARGEVIGALDVQSVEPAAFREEDVAVLQTLADQVAVAIDNARLFQQVQESLEAERRAYGQLSREAWQELIRSETGLSFISDARDTVPAADLWRPEMRTALRTGEITPVDGQSGPGTRLAIPIKVRDQIVGVIDGRKSNDTAWTEEEIDLLQTLTDQLSVALESARLYRDTQRRAERERLVADITAKVRASSDVETIMRTAVRELGNAMRVDRTRVLLAADRGHGMGQEEDELQEE
jgi:GAF domain-containing protein